ncbi:MAG: Ig domain-containing protein, partial [Chitinivibrionales bacterium]|nr:Ig domain-containing protein [Chitinivibrionales bacterium]
PFPGYGGAFTQSVTVYFPLTGPYAWTPAANSDKTSFIIDANPNDNPSGSIDYSLECVVPITKTNTDTVLVGQSADYFYNPWGVNTFTKITQTGWYDFTFSFMKSGNMTTDPAIAIMGVYNHASGQLVGAYIKPGNQGNAYTVPSWGTPSSSLLGTDYIDISGWQAGFAGNKLAVDNFQSYLGFPNAATAPVVSNSGSVTATIGAAFHYQISGSNSPTSYQALGLPAGLTLNAATGAIAGTPTATVAETSSVVLVAFNATGVGVARIAMIVGSGATAALVQNSSAASAQFRISQNYSSQTITFKYNLDFPAYTHINIYSVEGQKLANIFEGNQGKGVHETAWENKKLSPGIYMISLQNNTVRESKLVRLF